ncbi:DNRLRE domain-containing protein [Bacteroidales bacterium OttesenSCG-928-L14]|nr:DNRLRE domain-containing protein [Bacteroidales bacterium OttesenSCG-928-L14]
MKKLLLLFIAILFGGFLCQAQTTVTFKPGADVGKDANVYTTYGCVLYHNTLPSEDMNYGNHSNLYVSDWTYNALGCSHGTIRSLLKFEELSTIPINAEIISAELKLYGVSTSCSFNGNSSYPNAPCGLFSNKSFIQRITSAWGENTVTWNTQPSTTTANQITIPQSTSQWNWNFSDNSNNLVTMVQDMVSNPSTNYGFMIRLEDESYYRSLIFASSDHDDPMLWPELTVTYKEFPNDTIICPCEANFTYFVNTATPNCYFFSASNSAIAHSWKINGENVSSEGSFAYNLSAGENQICYTRILDGITCEKCITICVTDVFQTNDHNTNNNNNSEVILDEDETIIVPQGVIPPGDVVNFDRVTVYPNPTTSEWTVKIISETDEIVTVQLVDVNGKTVLAYSKRLTSGHNNFSVNTTGLNTGHYIIKITGDTIKFSGKLVKE